MIFTSIESQESLLFHHMLPVRIRPATSIPKPWQVEHEINNKIGVTFFCHSLRRRVERLRRSVYAPKLVQFCVRILYARKPTYKILKPV